MSDSPILFETNFKHQARTAQVKERGAQLGNRCAGCSNAGNRRASRQSRRANTAAMTTAANSCVDKLGNLNSVPVRGMVFSKTWAAWVAFLPLET